MSSNLRFLLSSPTVLLFLLLALVAVGCDGCGDNDNDFPRGGPGDDDDGSPDDDDDDSGPNGDVPQLVVTAVSPDIEAGADLTATMDVTFTVSDSDSDGYVVEVSFSSTGVSGEFSAATLAGEEQNLIGAEPGAPIVGHENSFTWDVTTDLVGIIEQVALELCPFDSEGNPGPCAYIEGDEGGKIAPTDLGAFCQIGHMEAMEWANGEALVPLSDGDCLNYQRTDPADPEDFSAQFLLVLVNPTASPVVFTVSPVAPPENIGDDDDDDDDDDSAPGDDDDDDDSAPGDDDDDDSAAGDDDDDSAAGDDDDDSAAGDDDDSSAPPPLPPRRSSSATAPKRTSSAAAGNRLTTKSTRARAKTRLAPSRATPRAAIGSGGPPPAIPGLNCTPDVTEADVHNNNLNFELRSEIAGSGGLIRENQGGNLYALGEHVALYVDDETPIDWDADCEDPNNSLELSDLPAFGFDNCDLDEVVETVDNNIWPTLTSLYGDPSDVDQNCRVTIFLSHRVNRLTQTNDTPDDDLLLVKSFAEPGIDLWRFDGDLNPNSNEEEIIFLYAPDPVGFWGEIVPLDDYLNFEVAGRIAVALQDLISYANHREVAKSLLDPTDPEDVDNPPEEEDWLNDAMGLLAADVTGYGAISYPDAWLFLDRSHLLELQVNNTLEDFRDRGGQYLFARYLHDLYGDDMITTIINSEAQGADSVMMVAEDFETFQELALAWATAMAISGRTNVAGGQLVPDAVVPNYHQPSTVVVADPENPQPGELYGANGYQLGFDVHGENHVYQDGAVAGGPTEIEDSMVRTGNLDHSLFHPQTDYFGTISGSYGVAVVLVGGLEQAVNYLKVETTSNSNLLGNVIRVDNSNPHSPSLTLEDVDGAKITTVRQLGTLDPSGVDRHIIGRIDPAENLSVSLSVPPPEPEGDDDDDSAGPPPLPAGGDDDDAADDDDDDAADDDDDDEPPADITIVDTDRYGFSLTATTSLGVWIDRRVSTLEGQAELADPFFAVAPLSDVPNAFDYAQWGFGPLPAHGPCYDPTFFSYPLTMPIWLGAQANLAAQPTIDPVFEVGDWLDFVDGNQILDCLYDHDQDGIADVDEFEPETLMAQILLRQGENLMLDPDYYESTFGALPGFRPVDEPWWDVDFVDLDSNEAPENDYATAILPLNIGGRSVEGGEEAVWYGTLPPGDYIIVVGDGSGSTGPYDMTVRVLGN